MTLLSLSVTEGWYQTGEKTEQHLISKRGTTAAPRQPQVFLDEVGKVSTYAGLHKKPQGYNTDSKEAEGWGLLFGKSWCVTESFAQDPLSDRYRQIRLPVQSGIACLSKFQGSTVREELKGGPYLWCWNTPGQVAESFLRDMDQGWWLFMHICSPLTIFVEMLDRAAVREKMELLWKSMKQLI